MSLCHPNTCFRADTSILLYKCNFPFPLHIHCVAHLLLLKYICKKVLDLWLHGGLCSVLLVNISVSYCGVKCTIIRNQQLLSFSRSLNSPHFPNPQSKEGNRPGKKTVSSKHHMNIFSNTESCLYVVPT